MATRRPTHGKRERDRAKKAKQQVKRERRLEGPEVEVDEDGNPVVAVEVEVDEGQVIARLEELHRRYDAEEIEFEEFEESRAALLARLASG
jgi:hypothetical protein